MSGIFYNQGANTGSIGNQEKDSYFQRKALIEAQEEQYFTQLADVTNMPRNTGKTIKLYHLLPILDDRNLNDQGIDAQGVTKAAKDATGTGNLWGSSKDAGRIVSRMPLLTEGGERQNRIGFTRVTLEGSMYKLGFFYEYSEDVVQFDTQDDLVEHFHKETIIGANKISEDLLQNDLLSAAGTIRYTGTATSKATTAETSVVTYNDLMRLGIDLDNNLTPKSTTIITGTTYVDTRVVGATRVAYIGSEMIPVLEAMKDLHGQKALKELAQYAAGTTPLKGEIGAIGGFRFVVVPNMQHFAGAGAASTSGDFHTTSGKIDVFPILVVGDKSFTTIGFQTDGKNVKFIQKHAAPGAITNDNPYGTIGIGSIQWWYGFLALRPERIGLIYSAAKL